jgi:YVTN family beta-propeller protein
VYYFGCIVVFLSSAWATTPNSVIATLTTGVTPAGIAITPDNRFAYVANNNNYGIPGSDSVTVLDLVHNTVVTTIHDASFNQPYTVTINAAGTTAYVTNSFTTTITTIDIATNTVSGVITGFNGPSGMVITPNGLFGYVNNYGAGAMSGMGNTVNVVDLQTNMIVGPAIVVGQAPAALAITPDGAYVYVANYVDGNTGTGTISIIRTSDNTVISPTITGFSGPFAITITSDGAHAYVTNFGSNNFVPYGTTVSVVDLATNTIVETISLGIQPAGIALTPDNRYAYVSNYNTLYSCVATAETACSQLTAGQGTVNIIDRATNLVIPPTISVGQSPNAIAIASNGEFACVTNYTSNTVSIVALQSFTLSVQACKTRNIFLTQEDLINKLTISSSGASLPVSYSIYRDAALTDLVATIPATQPSAVYLDHNRQPDVTYTYYIVGINDMGTSSSPVTVTVTQNCC